MASKHSQNQTRRNRLLERFDYECLYCSCELNNETLAISRIIQRGQGGNSSHSNLVAACVPCAKNRYGMFDFATAISKLPKEQQQRLVNKTRYILIRYGDELRRMKEGLPLSGPKPRGFWSKMGYWTGDNNRKLET